MLLTELPVKLLGWSILLSSIALACLYTFLRCPLLLYHTSDALDNFLAPLFLYSLKNIREHGFPYLLELFIHQFLF